MTRQSVRKANPAKLTALLPGFELCPRKSEKDPESETSWNLRRRRVLRTSNIHIDTRLTGHSFVYSLVCLRRCRMTCLLWQRRTVRFKHSSHWALPRPETSFESWGMNRFLKRMWRFRYFGQASRIQRPVGVQSGGFGMVKGNGALARFAQTSCTSRLKEYGMTHS